jgi:hypothetical protein
MKRLVVCFYIFIFSAFFVLSCATSANYEAKLKTWLGSDINNLIASWGPPSNVYTMPNGNKIYTWLWVGGTIVTTNYIELLDTTYTDSVTYWCKTMFTANTMGVVVSLGYNGNSCVSD